MTDPDWQDIFRADTFNKKRWAIEDRCYICEGEGCEKCYYIGGSNAITNQTEKDDENESDCKK